MERDNLNRNTFQSHRNIEIPSPKRSVGSYAIIRAGKLECVQRYFPYALYLRAVV